MGNKPSWYAELGYDYIVERLKKLDDNPIVSIGSSSCEHEIQLEKLSGRKIICVDPNPGEFASDSPVQETRQPDYATAEDYAKANPKAIGNCHLLLIWPEPNFSTYDVMAINLLKPKSVILVYESTGSSGGVTLRLWVEKIGGPGEMNEYEKKTAEDDQLPSLEYKIIGRLEKLHKGESLFDTFNHVVLHISSSSHEILLTAQK
jgi:hypothetical protein